MSASFKRTATSTREEGNTSNSGEELRDVDIWGGLARAVHVGHADGKLHEHCRQWMELGHTSRHKLQYRLAYLPLAVLGLLAEQLPRSRKRLLRNTSSATRSGEGWKAR